jgi:hypothetical protein
MNNAPSIDDELARQSIGREVELISGAIDMVASGGSPAITLAGLEFGPALVQAWSDRATAAGVALEPLWHPDDTGCDIRVQRALDETERD